MYKLNKKQWELVKVYIFIFTLLFIAVNWDSVSWMFSYHEISGIVYDFFNPYPDSKLLVSASDIRLPAIQTAEAATVAPSAPAQPVKTYPYSTKDNSLEIPAIGIETALVIGENTDVPTLERDLDKGAVIYPGSVSPGQNGQMVVLGHSAPPGWPHIKHDWVFSDVQKLKPGDEITMYFNNRQYVYKVTDTKIIKRGQEVGGDGLTGKNNILTIVSCWPPGKDYQRIAVYAQLQ